MFPSQIYEEGIASPSWTEYTPDSGFYNAYQLEVTGLYQYDGVYKAYTDFNSPDGRHAFNLFTNEIGSDWYNRNGSGGGLAYGNVYLELPMSIELTAYRLNGPDYVPATPDEWTLYGSSDNGATWTEIHNKIEDISQSSDGLLVEVDQTSITAYNAFKWNFRKTTDLTNEYIGLQYLYLYTSEL